MHVPAWGGGAHRVPLGMISTDRLPDAVGPWHPAPAGPDLEACLFGGQAFTWWKHGHRIEGIARGTHVTIDPQAGIWQASPSRSEGFLATYLGDGRTQPAALADDPALGGLARAMPGLRLLDQEPWEGVLAFMISPVNNVPRIQETIARLCLALGPGIGPGHGIPRPGAVAEAGEERLRELGLGFRAPRLWQAACRFHDGDLDLAALAKAPIAEARATLQTLDGVGPKVAECILCYALGFDQAFPVDRWVARASEQVLGTRLDPDQACARWGDRAAMAQQLLFHGARMGHVAGLAPSPMARFDGWRALVRDG